jgi:phosphatidylglycerol:prolipoprotein diacylglycerol transferase
MILGVILGGRLGYVAFYNPAYFLANPADIAKIWQGGMSFHGGLAGVLIAMWLYGRRLGKTMWQITDFVAPLVPLGLGFGRIGNFINGELWGKPADVPWAFSINGVGLHPSQLYEAMLEGFVLFAILWIYSSKPRPYLAVSGLFLLLYGVFRFFVEFYRVPDAHLNYLALGWVTMGQILSLPMILVGALILYLAYRNKQEAHA